MAIPWEAPVHVGVDYCEICGHEDAYNCNGVYLCSMCDDAQHDWLACCGDYEAELDEESIFNDGDYCEICGQGDAYNCDGVYLCSDCEIEQGEFRDEYFY